MSRPSWRGTSSTFGTDRVAAVLGAGLDDLGPLLASRVAPPASGLRQLKEASE